MRDDEVPDNRLELFGVRCDGFRRKNGDDQAGIRDVCSVAAIAANDAQDSSADLTRQIEAGNQVHADVAFHIAATDREDEDGIARRETTAAQPVGVAGLPSLVVDAGRQLGDIVGGGVALDAGNLAEVVDRMAGMTRAAADTQKEDAAAAGADLDQ